MSPEAGTPLLGIAMHPGAICLERSPVHDESWCTEFINGPSDELFGERLLVGRCERPRRFGLHENSHRVARCGCCFRFQLLTGLYIFSRVYPRCSASNDRGIRESRISRC